MVIYVFSDENCFPKYVGKTTNLRRRHRTHLRDRFKYDTYFYRWLNKQIREGKEYFLDVLEEVNVETWAEREKYWIKHIKELNYELTNMTDGGDGNVGGIPNLEANRKRSIANMNHTVSPETRAKISIAHKGRERSEETRKKQSISRTGVKCSTKEGLERIRQGAIKGWETRRKNLNNNKNK